MKKQARLPRILASSTVGARTELWRAILAPMAREKLQSPRMVEHSRAMREWAQKKAALEAAGYDVIGGGPCNARLILLPKEDPL
jgi:hypothetical protein